MKRLLALLSILALVGCADTEVTDSSCAVGTTIQGCPCTDGSLGSQVCDNTGAFGACQCAATGPCTPNTLQACTCPDGSQSSMACGATGAWGACSCSTGAKECTPGQADVCITVCGASIGQKTCTAQGQWGTCVPPQETCNNKDDDCDGKVDDGLQRNCATACGNGTEVCVSGSWTGCSAIEPSEEVCDGKDNDCDGKVDLAANGTPLEQDCYSNCGLGSQTCINATWGLCSSEPQQEICDGLDNDCNGIVDDASGAGCNCVQGTTQSCGTTAGSCQQGQQSCLQGGYWSECGGTGYVGPAEELCDGLDNDCDGQTDEGNPGGGTVCGTPNNSQGGAFNVNLPCTLGLVSCVAGQLQCVGGVNPSPEACDNIDNDCDGEVDEDPTGDQYEPNDSCSIADDLGYVVENQGYLSFQGNLFPQDDQDWFRITAKELGDSCASGDEGPFSLEVRLSPPASNLDYDVCVYPTTESCGQIESGSECLSWAGAGETDVVTSDPWTGSCNTNDDRTFIIQVIGYSDDDFDACKPYTLEVGFTGQ
ncbi:MAG: MopE-related protein [Myxococcota bacterium]|nr:MopE-related protein [Myxococcota bacterium]